MKNKVEPASETTGEYKLRRFLLSACLFLFLFLNLLISIGPEWLLAFLEIDVYPFYPSDSLSALCLILSYAIMVATTICRSAGFAVIGYSVLRFDGKRSARLLLVAFAGLVLSFVSTLLESFYEYGSSVVVSNYSYFVPLWISNLLLGVFSYSCLFFLCVIFRRSFPHKGNLRISAFSASGKRRGNPLLTLYFWMTAVSFFFGLIQDLFTTYSEIRAVGWPESGEDVFALLLPYLELAVLTVLYYAVSVLTGRILSRKDASFRGGTHSSGAETPFQR